MLSAEVCGGVFINLALHGDGDGDGDGNDGEGGRASIASAWALLLLTIDTDTYQLAGWLLPLCSPLLRANPSGNYVDTRVDPSSTCLGNYVPSAPLDVQSSLGGGGGGKSGRYLLYVRAEHA